jgi:hypothetical protein
VKDISSSHINSVVGAAIFDLSGLPKEYFITSENADVSWVQTVFQALGLQSLLISSLRLEGFRYALSYGTGYCAIVVRQKTRYLALLARQDNLSGISDSFIQEMQDLEPDTLRNDTRFSLV